MDVEMGRIFGGFCLCCLWYWCSRAPCSPWTDYCDSVLFVFRTQACTIQVFLKELLSLL